jgi:aryl-alcohol dehydrogenase-like predicted oxidoreductase
MDFLHKSLADSAKAAAMVQLEAVAAELGCSMAQLAIAWVASNPRVSTVITGASKLSQLQANLAAVNVLPRLTPEVKARLDHISTPLAE